MNYNSNNIFEYIKKWSSKVDDFINQSGKTIDEKVCEEIVSEYTNLGAYLTSMKNVPKSVKTFFISDEREGNVTLPPKYKPLNKINDFYKTTSEYFKKELEFALKKSDFDKIVKCLVFAVKTDIKNVKLFNNITGYFEDNNLNRELIELYNLILVYTLDASYFEKIGDIYYKTEDYNSALDSYLSCAESSEESVGIYKKLANVFEKINDNDSRLACLEHIKILEGKNET